MQQYLFLFYPGHLSSGTKTSNEFKQALPVTKLFLAKRGKVHISVKRGEQSYKSKERRHHRGKLSSRFSIHKNRYKFSMRY